MQAFQNLDELIVLFTAEHLRFGALNAVMVFFTILGNAVWPFMGIALMLFKKHRRCGFIMLLCLGLSTVVNTVVLKNIIARPRPFLEIEGLLPLITPISEFSFPSGHAATSLAAAFSLKKSYGRLGAFSFIPAALIALSRVYVSVHYLSDVIVGAALGLFCAWLVCLWFEKTSFPLFKQSP